MYNTIEQQRPPPCESTSWLHILPLVWCHRLLPPKLDTRQTRDLRHIHQTEARHRISKRQNGTYGIEQTTHYRPPHAGWLRTSTVNVCRQSVPDCVYVTILSVQCHHIKQVCGDLTTSKMYRLEAECEGTRPGDRGIFKYG